MAFVAFLMLDGVQGESKDAAHKGEIHLNSYAIGASNAGVGAAGGGSGSCKVSFQDVVITKFVDKASSKLLQYCASGKHISKGVITARTAGDKPLEFLKIELTDVVISSMQHVGNSSGDQPKPVETVTLNFAKIAQNYVEQKADGTGESPVSAGWDLKANKPA
jgi:type VI secretion system secreted protein Hcp